MMNRTGTECILRIGADYEHEHEHDWVMWIGAGLTGRARGRLFCYDEYVRLLGEGTEPIR